MKINLVTKHEETQLNKLREISAFAELAKELPKWPVKIIEEIAGQSVILQFGDLYLLINIEDARQALDNNMNKFDLNAKEDQRTIELFAELTKDADEICSQYGIGQ